MRYHTIAKATTYVEPFVNKPEYKEGFFCFYEGQSLTENPYNDGTPEHKEWKYGWIDASKESSYANIDAAGK